MKTRSVVPLYELEAPGLEQSRLSVGKMILLFPLMLVFLAFVATLLIYHSLSKKPGFPLHTPSSDLRISFRKMQF